MSTVINLGALNFGGFTIVGDDPGDRAGVSVSSAGDINKDGFDDLIIGAPGNNDGGAVAGAAYVIFGKAGGFGTIDLTNLQPSNGFVIRGDSAYDRAGWSVSSAGDVNGDGFDDIIVGAPFGDNAFENAGEAYVIYGKASGFGTVDLTTIAAGSGFVIQGPAESHTAGYDVSSAGDINGDGFDDLIVSSRQFNYGGWGSYYYSYDTTPSAYVIFGKANPAATINLATLPAADGFRVTSTSSDGWSNFSIAAAGDINGDGFDDIILGDSYGAGGAGEAYVIFGKATGSTNLDAGNLAPPNGFRIQGDAGNDWAGFSVAGAGDVNDDGFDDIVIGARLGDDGGTNAGQAYVIFGKATGFGTIDLTNLAAAAGFKIQGENSYDNAGYSVSGAGDVNGDGFHDIIISAPFSDNGGPGSGRAYVIFGKETGFGTIDLRNLAPSAGFKIQGDTTYDNAGFSVSGAGDINGDGFDDLLVGVPGGDAGGADAGEVYVIFGKAEFIQDVRNDFNGDGRSDVLWRSEAGGLLNWLGQANGGFVNNGANSWIADAPSNWQVIGTGDFNGDGRDDLLWRSTSGELTNWVGQANGGFVNNGANAWFTNLPLSWQVVGAGDFNGDGRDDLMWQSATGEISNWLGTANGGFTNNGANAWAKGSGSWHIVGTGDFNGDGRDDILWRSDAGQLTNWLGRADGGFVNNGANAWNGTLSSNWHVVGTGDFNGDGRDDIMWRSSSGEYSNWLSAANGGFTNNGANSYGVGPTSWHIVGIGDYNGDGRDDLLWRSDAGGFSNWLANANGGFINNGANSWSVGSTSWQVLQTDTLWI
jgi:hypothetical protein